MGSLLGLGGRGSSNSTKVPQFKEGGSPLGQSSSTVTVSGTLDLSQLRAGPHDLQPFCQCYLAIAGLQQVCSGCLTLHVCYTDISYKQGPLLPPVTDVPVLRKHVERVINKNF